MHLRQFTYLLEIEKAGSLNEAAKNLYVTQPTLSNSIKALEEELEYKILERTPKGTHLTAEGEKMIPGIEKILEIIDEWKLFSGNVDEYQGDFEFITAGLLKDLVSEIIFALIDRYPEINFMLSDVTGIYNEVSLLEEQKAHAYLIFCSDAEKLLKEAKRKGYLVRTMFQDKLCLYMNEQNPLARQKSIRMADVHNMEIFSLRQSFGYNISADELRENNNHIHIINNRKAIFEHITDNDQSVIVLTGMAGQIAGAGNHIVAVPVDAPDAGYALNLFIPKRFEEQPFISDFCNEIEKYIQNII